MFNLIRSEWIKLRYNLVLGIMMVVLVLISFGLASAGFGKLPEHLTADTPQFFTGVEMARGEFVFQRAMGDSSFTAWLSIVFTALFIGMEFTTRNINQAIFAGNSRLKIFIVKIVQCYIIACIVSGIYPLVSCLRYSLPWFSELSLSDVGYIFRCIGIKMLLDMAMMSIGIISTFALRDFIRPLAFNLIFTVVLSQLLGLRHSLDSTSILYRILNL
ncbi:MAG: ABC transporter permease, partial [Turicibacter sp.]